MHTTKCYMAPCDSKSVVRERCEHEASTPHASIWYLLDSKQQSFLCCTFQTF